MAAAKHMGLPWTPEMIAEAKRHPFYGTPQDIARIRDACCPDLPDSVLVIRVDLDQDGQPERVRGWARQHVNLTDPVDYEWTRGPTQDTVPRI